MRNSSNTCLPCSKVSSNSIKDYVIHLLDNNKTDYYVFRTNSIDWQVCHKSSFKELHNKYNKKKKTNGYEYYNIQEFRRD